MTHEHSPYFFLSSQQLDESELLLDGEDARHLIRVRRAKPGDIINVSDGRGRVARVSLNAVSEKSVRGNKLEEHLVPSPNPRVCVFQGLAKGGKVDFVVQKLVEIGVDEVVVFLSGRSVPRWDEDKQSKAQRRWRSIALEASKQSRRPWLPEVAGPVSLVEAQKLLASRGTVLVAHETAGKRLREAIAGAVSHRFALVVGPEGGLEDDEAQLLAESGTTVSLGAQILRTETAGLVAAAILLFELGRIG